MNTSDTSSPEQEQQTFVIQPSQVYASVLRKVAWKDPRDRFQTVEFQLGYTIPFEEGTDLEQFQREVWKYMRIQVGQQLNSVLGEVKDQNLKKLAVQYDSHLQEDIK